MSRYWSPVVHALTPYVPGEQPKIANLIKLNTNENPYGPSPKAVTAMRNACSDTLRLYPDPNSDALKARIASYHGVAVDQVFVGNSSDEVLAHTFQALLKHDKPLYFPDITYSFYPVYCDLYGIESRTPALSDAFEINLDDYADAGAVIFPNPNAPTGRLLPLDAIAGLATRLPHAPIAVDEAYIDFGGQSALSLIQTHPNILVVRTLSKSRSLAGLRVGYAIGHTDLIDGLERIKNSFNSYPLDRVAQAGALASFDDETHFRDTCQRVIESRNWLTQQLDQLGFDVIPSSANFVFARHPQRDAGQLAAALREKAILVRHFKLARIDQHLRISIGTESECAALVAALKAIME
ncbi:histidinol-phosphate transaminase [Chitinibacteraceae bacterium HSL-7]